MMNKTIERLLHNEAGNYILPFFWQHGEPEEVLRKYMEIIDGCGIKAVCLESRPHPGFCEEKWWHDLDIILDEAKTRGMKVWILDDRQFPTGYANGILVNSENELSRQSLVRRRIPINVSAAGISVILPIKEYRTAPNWVPSDIESSLVSELPHFAEDEIVSITVVPENGVSTDDIIDLTEYKDLDIIRFVLPKKGGWNINFVYRTRNCGVHREFINMIDRRSCRKQIEAVYEPHYERYKDEFGKTIAGFFSDEPELGNDHLYEMEKHLFQLNDHPFSFELQDVLKAKWKDHYEKNLPLLWEEQFDERERAKVRCQFMDAVTFLVRKNFSEQLADWCHEHHVEYIGHLIEGVNSSATSGSSLGHFFRGLHGQDMAGIDVIGGQVYPGGENELTITPLTLYYGEVFHYTLGKLANSAAAIEPWKKGRSMCEIFGNYGWSEGVRLEKYLIDHFLVRGVNHFVPHAFSPKEFPDPDCPPHFYAHGHNPQYRHFGKLMQYTNRVCELLSGGHHKSSAAVLYTPEGEWMSSSEYTPMMIQAPARQLTEAQIDFDFIPTDAILDKELYHTEIENGLLHINTQTYQAVIVSALKYLSEDCAAVLNQLNEAHIPILFIDRLPECVCTGETFDFDADNNEAVALEELPDVLRSRGIGDVVISPANASIRTYHYIGESDIFIFFNEGSENYKGEISLTADGYPYIYNAWNNRVEKLPAKKYEDKTVIPVILEPYKAMIVFFDKAEITASEPLAKIGTSYNWNDGWTRSICRSIEYPKFRETKRISLPDNLEQEKPYFSGFVCYEKEWVLQDTPKSAILEITDAYEGIEVFVNGQSLEIQIVPVYLFDLTSFLKKGSNQVRIEVATTLEREMSDGSSDVKCRSGISGNIIMWLREDE